MRIFVSLLIILIASLISCNKEDLVWNLPRTNTIDSLQNQNAQDPKFPLAKFSSSDTSVEIGSSINFISTAFGNPTSYLWSFAGGVPNSANQSTANVVYNNIGKYDVNLNVTNEFGSDSILKPNYVEAYYLKSFNNSSWDGWINNGWSFNSSPTCLGCIYAWQSQLTPVTYTITKSFDNVSLNSKLEFYYYIYSPSGTLKVKVNGVEVWSHSQNGSNTISVQIPGLSSFTLTFEATVSNTQSIYLNNIKIRP
jgi:PKD repeat protein